MPLILAGWAFSTAREKHERWESTVEWARNHGYGGITDSVPVDAFAVWRRDSPARSPDSEVDKVDE